MIFSVLMTHATRRIIFSKGKRKKTNHVDEEGEKLSRDILLSDSIIRRETHVEYAPVDFHVKLLVTRGRDDNARLSLSLSNRSMEKRRGFHQ